MSDEVQFKVSRKAKKNIIYTYYRPDHINNNHNNKKTTNKEEERRFPPLHAQTCCLIMRRGNKIEGN